MVYSEFTFLCIVVIALHTKYHYAIGSTLVFGLVVSIVSLLLTPILLVICCVFAVYRSYAKKRLQKFPGFVEMMDGSDAYWSRDDPSARNIINVILMIDFSKIVKEGKKPIEVIRERMKRVVDEASYKFKCKKRLSKYGYFYLEKSDVDFHENVRHIQTAIREKADLEKFASEIVNQPIAMDSFWEILVGGEEFGGSYPIIFRTHHGLGDGYSLIRLFTDHLFDHDTKVPSIVNNDTQETILQRLVNGKFFKIVTQVIGSVLDAVSTYIHCTAMMAEFLMALPDRNCLHNRSYLSGKKICRYTEMKMEFLKEVRRSLNVRFMDLLVTAVSDSLEGCFANWGETVEQIRIVITARLPVHTEGMNNFFTVGFPKIPITGTAKIRKIQVRQDGVKKLTDSYAMYWLLWLTFTIFPATIASKHFDSPVTMSVSNVPGPKECLTISGCRLTDLAFFSPNRDTTGVGLAFLSYGDKFNIGVTVDEALLSSPDQADQILDGIVQSLRQMHRDHAKSLET